MQDGIGHREHAFGADLSGGGAKEGQQFGRAAAFVLMRQELRMPFELPRCPGLGDGLIGPGFILVQLHDAGRFRLLVGLLDQSFFSGVCGS
jgi:hypothetical protein